MLPVLLNGNCGTCRFVNDEKKIEKAEALSSVSMYRSYMTS